MKSDQNIDLIEFEQFVSRNLKRFVEYLVGLSQEHGAIYDAMPEAMTIRDYFEAFAQFADMIDDNK
jgi:hypothetical protein